MSPPRSNPRYPSQKPPFVGEIFTIDDLVGYLKLPKSTVYKLAQERKIPGQKVGRHWRFRKETIDRWLDRQERAGR